MRDGLPPRILLSRTLPVCVSVCLTSRGSSPRCPYREGGHSRSGRALVCLVVDVERGRGRRRGVGRELLLAPGSWSLVSGLWAGRLHHLVQPYLLLYLLPGAVSLGAAACTCTAQVLEVPRSPPPIPIPIVQCPRAPGPGPGPATYRHTSHTYPDNIVLVRPTCRCCRHCRWCSSGKCLAHIDSWVSLTNKPVVASSPSPAGQTTTCLAQDPPQDGPWPSVPGALLPAIAVPRWPPLPPDGYYNGLLRGNGPRGETQQKGGPLSPGVTSVGRHPIPILPQV